MASTDSSLFSHSSKEKAPSALRTISEASDMLEVPQHVLRFWETKFHHIKPLKRNGGRRFYRPQDLEILQQIKHLLYSQGYTIKGAKKAIDEFAHGRGEWLSTMPAANVNDNNDVQTDTDMDTDSVLGEIALALNEPQEPVEQPIAAPAMQLVANNQREALAALRMQLAQARDTLANRLKNAA